MQVQTPDGVCDAVFIHPTTGTHPGVLVWPDAFGLRPTKLPIGRWPALVEQWLNTIGVLSPQEN